MTPIKTEITELRARLDALEKRVEKEDGGVFVPKDGDEYYFVGHDGNPIDCIWNNSPCDLSSLARGNVYPTREAAELADRKRVAEVKFRGLAKGFVPDWKDMAQAKHFVVLNNYEDKFDTGGVVWRHQAPGMTYFATKKDMLDAITAMGDDLYLVFGVGRP